jgi:hypothetical protein
MSFWNTNNDATEEDVAVRVAASAFSNITDSIVDTHSAIKVLAITVTAELGAFAMFYVSKDKVVESLAESDLEVWLYGGLVVFVIGFLTAFAAYRLVANKWPHRRFRLYIWPVSICAGILNVLLFFGFVTLELR